MLEFLLPFFASAFTVFATVETEVSPYPGDSIDDTAIWVNHDQPDESLIFATLKASNQRPVLATGLLVYNLRGEQLAFYPGGTPNNIDIRQRTNQPAVLAVSHWYSDKVFIYQLNEKLEPIEIASFDTGMERLRGTCLYAPGDNQPLEVFAISENGRIQQHRILLDNSTALLREFKLDSRAEGCVVDDRYGHVFISEEEHGIWRINARSNEPINEDANKLLVDKVRFFGPLKSDIEGLALATHKDQGYLIASSQGNSRFVIYDRLSLKRLGHFRIRANKASNIDGTTNTDGISVFTGPLGNLFPHGVFIAHDDSDSPSLTEKRRQNFKLVPWQQIESQLTPAKSKP